VPAILFCQVQGSGHGLGSNPVTGDFVVFVNDLCPECKPGETKVPVHGIAFVVNVKRYALKKI
jgi:hypothetical protein